MKNPRSWQVKQVFRLTGVSVRALHHYHAIGLLVPSGRSPKGYRLYSEADLLRLQQVLIGRELGLSLEEIRRLLDDPKTDRRQALTAQRAQLQQRAERTAEMIRAVDHALALRGEGFTSKGRAAKMEPLFEGFDPQKYEAEAETRWADTVTFRESKRRTARYGPEDWKRMKAEQALVFSDLAALQASGTSPSAASVGAVIERHRALIDRWFYPCDHTMHLNLANLYEADGRFAANIDQHRAGLTVFLVAAIRAQ